MTISIPDEAMRAIHPVLDAAAGELRLAAAAKLYEIGRLSSGAAAELAGVPRTVFLSRLADYGVSTFHLTEEELRRELA